MKKLKELINQNVDIPTLYTQFKKLYKQYNDSGKAYFTVLYNNDITNKDTQQQLIDKIASDHYPVIHIPKQWIGPNIKAGYDHFK